MILKLLGISRASRRVQPRRNNNNNTNKSNNNNNRNNNNNNNNSGIPLSRSWNSSPSRSRQSSKPWRHLPPVYVYDGHGAADKTVASPLFSSLGASLTHPVKLISAQEIIQGHWRHSCAAIVFGGGKTSDYVTALTSQGATMIRDYVTQDGGTYVGICAGAYLACDIVCFDKGGKNEIYQPRPLGFFKGTCRGPVTGPSHLPLAFLAANHDVIGDTTSGISDTMRTARTSDFVYAAMQNRANSDNFSGAVVAETSSGTAVTLPIKRRDVITMTVVVVDGGGVFLPGHPHLHNHLKQHQHHHHHHYHPPHHHHRTMAVYPGLPHTPTAVVKCTVGLNGGTAILCSPHLELPVAFGRRRRCDASQWGLRGDEAGNDVTRQRCWRAFLRAGNLEVVSSSPLPLPAAVVASRREKTWSQSGVQFG